MGRGTVALQDLVQVRVADALLKHLLCRVVWGEVSMDVGPGHTHTLRKPRRKQQLSGLPCLALPLGLHAGRGGGLQRDAGVGGYLGRLQMMLSPQMSFPHPALSRDTHLPGLTDDHAHPMA